MSVSYDRQEILSQLFEILPVSDKCKIINKTVRSRSVREQSCLQSPFDEEKLID